MKKAVQVTEVEGEGLVGLLGQRVTLFCMNYFYTGILAGVNEQVVLLEGASVVYETGPLKDKEWQDAQELPGSWYVRVSAIESYGILK